MTARKNLQGFPVFREKFDMLPGIFPEPAADDPRKAEQDLPSLLQPLIQLCQFLFEAAQEQIIPAVFQSRKFPDRRHVCHPYCTVLLPVRRMQQRPRHNKTALIPADLRHIILFQERDELLPQFLWKQDLI